MSVDISENLQDAYVPKSGDQLYVPVFKSSRIVQVAHGLELKANASAYAGLIWICNQIAGACGATIGAYHLKREIRNAVD